MVVNCSYCAVIDWRVGIHTWASSCFSLFLYVSCSFCVFSSVVVANDSSSAISESLSPCTIMVTLKYITTLRFKACGQVRYIPTLCSCSKEKAPLGSLSSIEIWMDTLSPNPICNVRAQKIPAVISSPPPVLGVSFQNAASRLLFQAWQMISSQPARSLHSCLGT